MSTAHPYVQGSGRVSRERRSANPARKVLCLTGVGECRKAAHPSSFAQMGRRPVGSESPVVVFCVLGLADDVGRARPGEEVVVLIAVG